MITFLLILIVLMLIPGARQIIGALFWIAVIMIIWHWPSDEAAKPTAAIEQPAISIPEPIKPLPLIDRGTGIDYGPTKPRRYIQQ
jgi:hypothetical protein